MKHRYQAGTNPFLKAVKSQIGAFPAMKVAGLGESIAYVLCLS